MQQPFVITFKPLSLGFVPQHYSLDWHGELMYLTTAMGENSVVDTAANEYGA